jgi:segregation and condensation protein A
VGLDFDLEDAPRGEDRLTLDLDGWEGPLDLLLTLARTQKSIWEAVDSGAGGSSIWRSLAGAKKLKLEIAADYLVMAAWLAYLKSCLLLPKQPEADPSPEELAARLQLRLQRLQAMREREPGCSRGTGSAATCSSAAARRRPKACGDAQLGMGGRAGTM